MRENRGERENQLSPEHTPNGDRTCNFLVYRTALQPTEHRPGLGLGLSKECFLFTHHATLQLLTVVVSQTIHLYKQHLKTNKVRVIRDLVKWRHPQTKVHFSEVLTFAFLDQSSPTGGRRTTGPQGPKGWWQLLDSHFLWYSLEPRKWGQSWKAL